MNLLKLLNRRGITTDVFVIVLLIIGLAVAILLIFMFSGQSKELISNLSALNVSANLTK